MVDAAAMQAVGGILEIHRGRADVPGQREVRRNTEQRRGTERQDTASVTVGRNDQALGIDGALGGADLARGDRGVEILDDGTPPPTEPGVSTRVGLTKGADLPWRWFVPGVDDVSR